MLGGAGVERLDPAEVDHRLPPPRGRGDDRVDLRGDRPVEDHREIHGSRAVDRGGARGAGWCAELLVPAGRRGLEARRILQRQCLERRSVAERLVQVEQHQPRERLVAAQAGVGQRLPQRERCRLCLPVRIEDGRFLEHARQGRAVHVDRHRAGLVAEQRGRGPAACAGCATFEPWGLGARRRRGPIGAIGPARATAGGDHLGFDLVDLLFGPTRGLALGGERVGAGAGAGVGSPGKHRFARPSRVLPFLPVEQEKTT